jgi:hypothetical protein
MKHSEPDASPAARHYLPAANVSHVVLLLTHLGVVNR